MSNMTCSGSIDLTKFILSLMVVSIHVNPWGGWVGVTIPLARVAVPIFFLISSYLLFYNLYERPIEESGNEIRRYIFRIFKLYFSWFILLLPITLYVRTYFNNGLISGIRNMVIDFMFGSTFIASWYLMALAIDVSLVYLAGKHFGNKLVIFLGLILYVVCCFMSNYGFITENWRVIKVIRNVYPVPAIYNSFPSGVIWIVIGKVLAEKKDLRVFLSRTKRVGGVISAVLFSMEILLINYLKCSYETDCYFMLIPLCLFIFINILDGKLKIKCARELRVASTVIYCMHASVSPVLRRLLQFTGISLDSNAGAVLNYIMVVVICIATSCGLLKISNYNKLKWVNSFF